MSDPAPSLEGAWGPGSDEGPGDPADPLSVNYAGPTTEPPPAAAETPTEPAPTEPAAPEPAAPEPTEPAAPAPAEPTEPAAPAAEEPAHRWAGRFQTPEEMERSWVEGQDLLRRQGARANTAEQQLRELETAVRGYLAEQQAKEKQPGPAAPAQIPEPSDAELAQAGMDRETYRAIAPLLQAQVEARVAPMQRTIQAYEEQQRQLQASMATDQSTRQAAQEAEEAASEVAIFRSAHPEFARGSDQEGQLAELIQRFNAAWTGDPSGNAAGAFEVGNHESLEIAAEALARPVLADLLMVRPEYMDSDKGMEIARAEATLIEATNRATTGTQPATGTIQSPHVESGATGVPPTAPEGTTRDAFDEVLDYDKTLRSRSIFAG